MRTEVETVYFSLVDRPEDSVAQQARRLGWAEGKVDRVLAQLTEMGMAEAPGGHVRAVGLSDAIRNLTAHAVLKGAFEYLADARSVDEWLTRSNAQARREIITVGTSPPGGHRRASPPSEVDGYRKRGLVLRGIASSEVPAYRAAAVGWLQLGVSEADVRLADHGPTNMVVMDRQTALVQVSGELDAGSIAITSQVVAGLLAVFDTHWRRAKQYVHMTEDSGSKRQA